MKVGKPTFILACLNRHGSSGFSIKPGVMHPRATCIQRNENGSKPFSIGNRIRDFLVVEPVIENLMGVFFD
jgi:hypothetical protein